MTQKKRIMVDMSATWIHHGHARLLDRVRKYIKKGRIDATLVVGLTTDEEIKRTKGYVPELRYEQREELLKAFRGVEEVVPVPWLLTQGVLEKYEIDLLVHGDDNANEVKNLLIFPRTQDIASRDLRKEALRTRVEAKNAEKPMFTPGPASLSYHALKDLIPAFGRDDSEYDEIERTVLSNTLRLTGHDHIVRMQGSATTAIDVATSNIVLGRILLLQTGYYSQRFEAIYGGKIASLPNTSLEVISYEDLDKEMNDPRQFDWVINVYTETATAFLSDIHKVRKLADSKGAKLFLDATGSINLEPYHELSDACAFSSCKGLGGLTGAGFITYKEGAVSPLNNYPKPFSLDLATYAEKKTTGPYHAICSLYSLSQNYEKITQNVAQSKAFFMKKNETILVRKPHEEPQLCTLFQSDKILLSKGVPYSPRRMQEGCKVVCHLGDMFVEEENIGDIYQNITIV